MSKKYGDYDIDDDLDIRKAKVKVTMYLDGDVLHQARETAKKQNIRYQTLINSLLRQSLLNESDASNRLNSLENRIHSIETMLKIS